MQPVVGQQQLVVAEQQVQQAAHRQPRAQQARARLEVGDRDEPPAGGRRER